MIDNKEVMAIIPARGGSKGLPGKNIKHLCGRPLITFSIKAALECDYIDETIVSTDYKEIAEIAAEYGAQVPFLRPCELSEDDTSTMDVIFHAIDWMDKYKNYQPEYILLLQPTSPLRNTEDINGAVRILKNKKAGAVVSVCKTDHPLWWSNTLPADGRMNNFIRKEILNKRRQDLPVYYRLNGAIYLARTDYIRKYNSFFGPDTFACKMPRAHSIDIDSILDFRLAELLYDNADGTGGDGFES